MALEWRNWIKHAITGCYLLVLVVVLPVLIWPILHTTSTPKEEAIVIATIFALLTLPISAYSIINHLGMIFTVDIFVFCDEPSKNRNFCRKIGIYIKKYNDKKKTVARPKKNLWAVHCFGLNLPKNSSPFWKTFEKLCVGRF